MASEIPEIFHVFGPQLNAFTSVGILLKYFRRKLLQLEWSKIVSNLGMFRFKLIYIADQGPVQTSCFCRAELKSGFKFDKSTAEARRLNQTFALSSASN